MPDATVIELADAIAALLTAGSYSQEFTAVRKYRPVYKLEELSTLRVTVVPREIGEELASRAMVYETHKVDIAIQKQLSASADEDMESAELLTVADGLMYLAQELRDALILDTLNLPGDVDAKCLSTQNAPIYDPEHFEKHRCFSSVITATYELVRAP